jgi:hypothetical protein
VRSRNGNRPFIYAICAITATISLLADDYLIGYRLTTRNAQSVQESLAVSKAMMPCAQHQSDSLTLTREYNEPLSAVLNHNKTLFLEYASAQEMRLKSNDTLLGTDIKTLQTLTLPTRCYAVEFNNRSVTITLLK